MRALFLAMMVTVGCEFDTSGIDTGEPPAIPMEPGEIPPVVPVPEPFFPMVLEITSMSPTKIHIYYGGGEATGNTPFTREFTEEESCGWGFQIAAEALDDLSCWYGCPGMPECYSLFDLEIQINGETVVGEAAHNPFACTGGEGNLELQQELDCS